MKDEPIRTSQDEVIIDGVNVVGCVRLQDDEISCELGGKCKGWENCHCKQLKRKEQECEALQMSDNEAREIVAELKAECEELKKKVKELNQGWIDCDKERNLQEANSEFRQRVINRYKQTFTEIKEIAEVDFNHTCWKTYAKQLEQILQKISEVLDD